MNLRQGSDSLRLSWADIPAMLLSAVSAVTVMSGAQLLRGQNRAVMFALGLGVAATGFLLKKQVVDRLNAIRPTQSIVTLLTCWLPVLLFSTFLSTLAAFSWLAPELAQRDGEQAFRAHWSHETDKLISYQSSLSVNLRKHTEGTQSELDAEQRRIAIARREGAPVSLDSLRSIRRRIAVLRAAQERVTAFQTTPVEPPADRTAALTEMNRAFREINELYSAAVPAVPELNPPQRYEPFNPPATDLQAVLFEETRRRTWQALVAWVAALWVEALPFFALYRGGRKIGLAIRIREWRRRIADISSALRGAGMPNAVPIVIEPLHVHGVVRVLLPAEFTLVDCEPFLEEAVRGLPGAAPYQIRRIANAGGRDIDEYLPLLPQLDGESLVVTVETRK